MQLAGAALALLGLAGAAAAAEVCDVKLSIDHADSPLAQLRNMGGRRDDFQDAMRSVAIDPARHRALPATEGIAASLGAVFFMDVAGNEAVVDARWLGPVTVADATRLTAGEKVAVATAQPRLVKELGLLRLCELLLRGGAIRTYAHVGSELCLRADDAKATVTVSGEHEYFTNERHVGRLAFTIVVAPDGAITVQGS